MKFLLAALLITLTGCTSTPTYVLGDQHNSAYHYTFKDNDPPIARIKCTLYEPPEVDKVPSIPLKVYSQLKLTEYDRRIDFLLNHIEELRLYISATRKLHAEKFKLYSDNCAVE